ncbi:hypothetical protein [Streptomyces virginiae]|uniref:hypothetical protein n=1 Tax=Streptomyces virginiae TaxID=1961 RepID=UPI0032447D45
MATTIFTGRYIAPLLEVRNRRFQTKMQAQEKITTSALSILTAVIKLREVRVPDGVTDTLRTALTEERARWRQQLDDATCHLTDHAQEFIFTFRGSIAVLGMRYCGTARMVWISDRTEEAKLRHLLEITAHFHTLYFGSRCTCAHASGRWESWSGSSLHSTRRASRRCPEPACPCPGSVTDPTDRWNKIPRPSPCRRSTYGISVPTPRCRRLLQA